MKYLSVIRILVLAMVLATGVSFAQMGVVNGASYDSTQPMAPGSFATIFGQDLCPQTAAGAWIGPGQLPTNLGGCTVMVNGAPAMMQYASPGQINFIVPANAASGDANLTVGNGSAQISGAMLVGPAGPGMFAINGMGVGEGAMLHGTLWRLGPFSTTTAGQPTYISMYMTGLDPSTTPSVSIGGVPAQVSYAGNAPGYAGLQQVNIMLPPGVAGAGRVPVTVTSSGQTSNVTFMEILPTEAMMQGMPGWGQGMMVAENMPRGHEMSYMAFNPSNGAALVTDENDDVVRVISLASQTTTATITLPSGSQAHSVAVDAAGDMAAVGLSAMEAVALIDLKANQVTAVVGTGYYPSRMAFAGTNLLVTNQAGANVSVIDTASATVTQTIKTGFGPSGIAAAGNTAVVANMGDGSLTIIDLTAFTATTVALPAGSRPHEVAISTQANKAIVTTPMTNGLVMMDLTTHAITALSINTAGAMGAGAVAVNGTQAYVADMMTAAVTAVDLSAGKVMQTFSVDPGPQALAVNPSANQLLVLAEGTGTLDVVDLASGSITARLNAGGTERQGDWIMPLMSSMTPNTAAAGSTVTLTIAGSGFQGVKSMAFYLGAGMGMGGGMMGGGSGGVGSVDTNMQVSNFQVNGTGTQITASVKILPAAAAGTRQVRFQTGSAPVMGMMSLSSFTVTN